MPYIQDREHYNKFLEPLLKFVEAYQLSSGDLNYILTRIILRYFMSQKNYQTVCNIDGVLNNISKEFYARVARPYENIKANENGDLPEFIELECWLREKKHNEGIYS